jgi:hypothetical protein
MRNPCEVERPEITSAQSQNLFEATVIGHKPLIDNRTPDAVKAGISLHEWRSYSGDE